MGRSFPKVMQKDCNQNDRIHSQMDDFGGFGAQFLRSGAHLFQKIRRPGAQNDARLNFEGPKGPSPLEFYLAEATLGTQPGSKIQPKTGPARKCDLLKGCRMHFFGLLCFCWLRWSIWNRFSMKKMGDFSLFFQCLGFLFLKLATLTIVCIL